MMKFGLLGCGGIAKEHLAAAARHRRIKFVHAVDVRLDVAQALADEYGVEKVSQEAARVLNDDEVEAVVIALPTHLHYEWIVRCAKAGKHILTEKPLCRTVRDGRRALTVCANCGVKLGVGYMRRYIPTRGKARQLVQSGKLGRPVTWTVAQFDQRSDYYRGPGNWAWDMENGGGIIMDGHIHDFDFATWILGPPVDLFAQSRWITDVVTAPTQASAIIRFHEGDTMLFGTSFQEGDFGQCIGPNSIVGPEGTIIFDGSGGFWWHYAPGKRRYYGLNWDSRRPAGIGSLWLFYKQLDSFIRLVEKDECDPRLATGPEALESLWLAEKVIAAGPDGRRSRMASKPS